MRGRRSSAKPVDAARASASMPPVVRREQADHDGAGAKHRDLARVGAAHLQQEICLRVDVGCAGSDRGAGGLEIAIGNVRAGTRTRLHEHGVHVPAASFLTVSGVAATRVSPGRISLGIPIRMQCGLEVERIRV